MSSFYFPPNNNELAKQPSRTAVPAVPERSKQRPLPPNRTAAPFAPAQQQGKRPFELPPLHQFVNTFHREPEKSPVRRGRSNPGLLDAWEKEAYPRSINRDSDPQNLPRPIVHPFHTLPPPSFQLSQSGAPPVSAASLARSSSSSLRGDAPAFVPRNAPTTTAQAAPQAMLVLPPLPPPMQDSRWLAPPQFGSRMLRPSGRMPSFPHGDLRHAYREG